MHVFVFIHASNSLMWYSNSCRVISKWGWFRVEREVGLLMHFSKIYTFLLPTISNLLSQKMS